MLIRRKFHTKSFMARKLKTLAMIGRCLLLCVWPVVIATAVSVAWYELIFKTGFHFGEKLEMIITAACIPACGILYSILVAIAINTVWAEYKAMRTAVKRYDIDAFTDLQDEDLSPLMHTIVLVASFAVLAGFLFLKYPDVWSGGILVAGVTFLLALMYAMIIEIDDPCSGLWFIRSIPEEWLGIDVKDYRKHRSETIRTEFAKKNGNGKLLGITTVSEDETVTLHDITRDITEKKN